MQYSDAWTGRQIVTADGSLGTIANRARTTVYVRLAGGCFQRYLVGDVEPLRPDEPVPPTIRRRRKRDRSEQAATA